MIFIVYGFLYDLIVCTNGIVTVINVFETETVVNKNAITL